MKKIVFCLFVLLFSLDYAHAATRIKPAAVVGAPAATNSSGDQKTGTAHERHNFISRIEARLLPLFSQQQEGWGHRGEGSRAIFWAVWGLFIWPLGILAIVHGVHGLSSHNGIEQDRATLALILGIGESLLFLGALVWLFTAPFYVY